MLMSFDPFREFDQLLRQAWGSGRFVGMPMDAYRRGDEFVVEFDLPGANRDSIDLTVERNVLQVTAQRTARYGDNDQVLAAERPHGTLDA
jgi:HSP20 family protein